MSLGARWPELEAVGVEAVVTDRGGGVSTGPYESLNLGLHVGDDAGAVVENRRRAAASIGATLDQLVFCRQTHGAEVAQVGAADRGRGALSQDSAVPAVDALVTTEAGVGLVVMVADCVPIVLVDPDARVLACVHAGWRGTVARVTEAAVAAMVAAGASAATTMAFLGPAIPPDRYQVGGDVAERAGETFGGSVGKVLRPDGTGRWRFDLWSANELVLRGCGVEQVSRALAVPTGGGRFFSDREQRPCGRFAAVAMLR